MFNDINKITLLGNIVRDPELRQTSTGTPVLNLSLATTRSYKQGEEWRKSTEFHDITCWRNAETLSQYITKGTRVYISGRLGYKSYEKDGVKKYKTEIVADEVILLNNYKGSEHTLPTEVVTDRGDNMLVEGSTEEKEIHEDYSDPLSFLNDND